MFPITQQTFNATVGPWLSHLAQNDLVAVMSYPTSDRQRRLLNLLEDHAIQNTYLIGQRQYRFITLDFRQNPIDNVDELEEYLSRQFKLICPKLNTHQPFLSQLTTIYEEYQIVPILVGMGAEWLILHHQTQVLAWCTNQIRTEKLRILLFFETNLFDHYVQTVLQEIRVFQPRLHVLKLYDRADSDQFLNYLTQFKWQVPLKTTIRNKLLDICGGSLLLLKTSIWYLRDHPNASFTEIINQPEMNYNLSFFYEGFSTIAQTTLKQIVERQPISSLDDPTIKYLEMTGVIKLEKQHYRITIPLFEKYLESKSSTSFSFITQNDQLLLNQTNITRQFSKSERQLLIYCCQHPNTLINREMLSTIIWPSNDGDYSDQALDSHLSRLRQKLTNLGVPRSWLIYQKGKGAKWQT